MALSAVPMTSQDADCHRGEDSMDTTASFQENALEPFPPATPPVGIRPSARRHHGETSMESFIKHHMVLILQPFVDQVQDIDMRLQKIQDIDSSQGGQIDKLWHASEVANKKISNLEGAQIQNAARAVHLEDEMKHAAEAQRTVRKNMDQLSIAVQQARSQVEKADDDLVVLRRKFGELERENKALHNSLTKTDTVGLDVKGELDEMRNLVKSLKSECLSCKADVQSLKVVSDFHSNVCQETRALCDGAAVETGHVKCTLEAALMRESEMAKVVEGLKASAAHFEASLEALAKDASFLRWKTENHDSAVHVLQQNHGSMQDRQGSALKAHDKMANELTNLAVDVRTLRNSFDDMCRGLTKTDDFVKGLRNSLDKMSVDALATGKRINGLEAKHLSLTETTDKLFSSYTEQARDHRRSLLVVEGLRHELEKTNEAFVGTKGTVETSQTRLGNVSTELDRTKDALQALETGVEHLRANILGMQKGFVETGVHVSSRPLTLPKLQHRDEKRESLSSDMNMRATSTLLTNRQHATPKEPRTPGVQRGTAAESSKDGHVQVPLTSRWGEAPCEASGSQTSRRITSARRRVEEIQWADSVR